MGNRKNTTYREQELFLNVGMNEVVFNDTNPNYVHINNLGASDLYLSVTGVPSTSVYDRQIPSYGEGLYSRPLGFKRIQIFVDGVATNRIKLVTFEDDFNPATLANGSVSVSGGGVASDVTIKGFTVPLPAGANNIGKVEVTSMPAQTFTLAELPAGTNTIGKVGVTTLPPLAAGESKIGTVGIVGGVTVENMPSVVISSMPPVEVTNDPVKQSHEYYEASIGTVASSYDMGARTITKFTFISNDDLSNDLYISFDNDIVGTVPGAGANGVIRLAPGESLNDFGRKCNKVNFIRSAGTGKVRLLGV